MLHKTWFARLEIWVRGVRMSLGGPAERSHEECDVGGKTEAPSLTIRHLHLSVANQLAGEEGLGVSMLNQSILNHLHHTESRLQM